MKPFQKHLFLIPKRATKTKKFTRIAGVFAALISYSCLLPIFLLDIWMMFYHFFYFAIFNYPRVKRKDYFSLERWNLSELNIFQKVNCIYCEYANGAVAYIKEVINRTEIYSCAIKRKHLKKQVIETHFRHQEHFYEQSDFNS
ncbi:hypothetical protein GF376_00825 [Candidatus Peregrinibacteria bacterium]|nr:hypothetical protein [Candidatus Peregrinibacteria bacterium]